MVSEAVFEKPLAMWVTGSSIYDGEFSISNRSYGGDMCLVSTYLDPSKEDVSFNDGEILNILDNVSPRVFFADKIIVEDNTEDILARMGEKYLPGTVFFDADEHAKIARRLDFCVGSDEIESDILSYDDMGNKVLITANVSAGDIMVLNDYYDPSWKAYINGKEAEILKANYLFRGVLMEKDGYGVRVEFRYVPTRTYFCIGISVVGFALLIILSILSLSMRIPLRNATHHKEIRRSL
jgi:hypothetical protein